MQIGDSSMVEHVSRSHKVPSSNFCRLHFICTFRLQSTLQNFFVVLGLVVVRAIIPTQRRRTYLSASAVESILLQNKFTLSQYPPKNPQSSR